LFIHYLAPGKHTMGLSCSCIPHYGALQQMKLEYLQEGSSDCPLIRLYDFTITEAEQLRDIINQLATGTNQNIVLHDLSWVESIGNCRLTFRLQSWDQAVVRRKGKDKNNFECGFTAGTWCNIEGLVEPFTKGDAGFQWLAGTPGEAAILISCDGTW
jgi:hypothetical protein